MNLTSRKVKSPNGIKLPVNLKAAIQDIRYVVPLMMISIYPSLYYYGKNARLLKLEQLAWASLTYLLIMFLVYFILCIPYHNRKINAAYITLFFLVFFNFYGLWESLLIRLDWITARFYTTIPIGLVTGYYFLRLVNHLSEQFKKNLWKILEVFSLALVIINLITIAPIEFRKAKDGIAQNKSLVNENIELISQENPDIYYIVLDEFSGFEPMREYWGNTKIDQFIEFLKSRGFEIIANSHGSSSFTLHQLATRLNYYNYPNKIDQSLFDEWFKAIADNKVMQYVKGKGYTTITFNELPYSFSAALPIISDISYNFRELPASNLGVIVDDFWILVADQTMLKELSYIYKKLGTDLHSNFIFFTTKKIGNLGDVATPKFVYAHLMLPHAPFMFDHNGNQNNPSAYTDYAYYLENYNFSMKVAEQLIDNILKNYHSENTPIIILQSDHGLRNYINNYTNQFPDFPEEYKTSILYARLIPGYQSTGSAQEADPINTFPILFNYLFDAGIPLQ